MLAALESKLTARVAEALGTRGVAVSQAPLPLDAPVAGQRRVRVSLDSVAAAQNFEAERTMFTGEAPDLRGRRVVHLGFTCRVRGMAQPAGAQPQQVSDARRLLLEDLSIVLHALDGTPFRTGDDLDAAGDPGYDVLSFVLAGGSVKADLVDGAVLGELEYRGTARVWPPGVSEEGTIIRQVDTLIEALPVDLRAVQPVLRAGDRTEVRVKVLSRTRGSGPSTAPARLAVTVLGDLPPAERGSLADGSAASTPGFTVYAVQQGVATITYVAPPPGFPRARTEHVAVHVATPDGTPGLQLGTVPIRLTPVVP